MENPSNVVSTSFDKLPLGPYRFASKLVYFIVSGFDQG
jgi:hypothetical protein